MLVHNSMHLRDVVTSKIRLEAFLQGRTLIKDHHIGRRKHGQKLIEFLYSSTLKVLRGWASDMSVLLYQA